MAVSMTRVRKPTIMRFFIVLVLRDDKRCEESKVYRLVGSGVYHN